ncbi:toll/interleukin-1 receptor domain-containing protein [Caulobacter sp. NIBR1757]|uniref:toll/interleukin-1 receptor domain-containing protein n=1 Tax=Caulobacter sp. NIBR1757 TaxID=3016000 RepID=UPI0022F0D428|nr:toll/interleukin-1 receptor domain-containing protein [Caulobacter sp. NIBR1757]WGM40384.1 hypothetical protein AMEJIAPC_03329 [Caulobacter sp. NIBR1757]
MTQVADRAAAGYRAFISYSHRDGVFAARLHRRLEAYRLPKALGVGRRLTPIFKDREELPAAADLGSQVREALSQSACLVVVCSPDAAASPWVAREIETFRQMHPDRPVLAALLRGEPSEAFPPALSAGGLEPLAADFRKQGDGERLAVLKLAAGLAGVGVDQLIRRDAQRRQRTVTAITAAAVAGMLIMGAMTTVALAARKEAERQRASAEQLVEFMLTDLRDGLKGAGSLPVQTKVNQRALDYYREQDFQALPAASRQRWARILLALAEDDIGRGDLDTATSRVDEAYRVTRTDLEASSEDADAIWTHAQSVFWRGMLAHLRRQATAAQTDWLEYARLAHRLRDLEPGTLRTLKELAYSENGLCSLAVAQKQDKPAALRLCASAVALAEQVSKRAPKDPAAQFDLATNHGWLADARMLPGGGQDTAGARVERSQQVAMLDRLLKSEPDNAKYLDSWATGQVALGRISFHDKDYVESRRSYERVLAVFGPLLVRDPTNASWRNQIAEARRAIAVVDAYEHKEIGNDSRTQ